MKKIILNSEDIINKIKRISFEIIEKNLNESEIYLVGLMPNGKYLSEKISKYISENSNINVNLIFIKMENKNVTLKEITSEIDLKDLNKKIIVFVDDVMNSGTTLIYALKKFLSYNPKEIQIGVLIERNYKNFPIVSNYKGLELSTSKEEHVEVILGDTPKVIIS